MSFANLGLNQRIVDAVTQKGYTEPTQIQAEAIPLVLAGKDLLAGSCTGSGKTASFTLPILHKISEDKNTDGNIKALFLVPTRELVFQVKDNVKAYSKYLKINTVEVLGGVSIRAQIRQLEREVDVLIATPGRLLDLVSQKALDLSHVQYLVLDEADRMLDLGFAPSIKQIMARLPKTRQSLLFSATFSPKIKNLAKELLNNPETISAKNANATAALITHKVFPVAADKKYALLNYLIKEQQYSQVLAFVKTKMGAEKLSKYLNANDIVADTIHSDKKQSARTRTLSQFKAGKLQVLIGTDIVARGIDIVDLPYVVNIDLPYVPEDYTHRIGRTGRAGKEGFALSFVAKEERRLLKDIERVIGQQISEELIDGFVPENYHSPVSRPANKRYNKPSDRRGAPADRRNTPNKSYGAKGKQPYKSSNSSFKPRRETSS